MDKCTKIYGKAYYVLSISCPLSDVNPQLLIKIPILQIQRSLNSYPSHVIELHSQDSNWDIFVLKHTLPSKLLSTSQGITVTFLGAQCKRHLTWTQKTAGEKKKKTRETYIHHKEIQCLEIWVLIPLYYKQLLRRATSLPHFPHTYKMR